MNANSHGLPPREELERVLRAQNWASVRARLFAFALALTRSPTRAEELADAAIVDCCDPRASPWNPDVEPDLVRHALRVLRNRLSSERRKQLVRTDPRNLTEAATLAAAPATPAESLQRAEDRAREERLVAAARARLERDLDHRLLALWLEGSDRPADQAARLEQPIDVIRRSRDRVKYAFQTALDDEERTSWKSAGLVPKPC